MWNNYWSDRHIALLSHKLHQLLDAGLPLIDALKIVQYHWPKKRKKDLDLLFESLQAGHPLSYSLQRIRYPPFFIFLVQAAEQHGQLVPALTMAGEFYRKRHHRRKKQIKALFYPSLILLSSTGTLLILINGLFPQFISLYQSFDAPLPPLTQILIEWSNLGRMYFFWILLTMFLLIGVAWHWLRLRWREWILRLPGISKYYRLQQTYLVCSQVGLLLESGVSILQVCSLFAEKGPNGMVQKSFTVVRERLLEGARISEAFWPCPYFLPVLHEMLFIAEQSGTLGLSLLRLGEQLEQELDDLTEQLASIGESLVTIGAGGIVFILMLLLFVPLFHLINQL
ncbi:type II secretion system F family protein [Ammoniphilus sp. CFH 90114]|uniref:type II secretion system F family protein n=1 Tax=Ammoniphilus sp. CFH 90114 TaxID=2493665 RepID=UPI0013E9411B|nr:type II secretion system F family protein [Ammoniphilus sp. CFH 90114]